LEFNTPLKLFFNFPDHTVCKEAQQKILKGHKKICSWPTNPTSDVYLNPYHEDFLSRDEKERLKQEFIDKAHRLLDLKKKLPHITLEILSEMVSYDDCCRRQKQLLFWKEGARTKFSRIFFTCPNYHEFNFQN